uniref:Uncharacterized protein n=1 Tax=Arundo donax TaxID=35708 RepID=A0A0A9C7E3_ARUDO
MLRSVFAALQQLHAC